MSIQEEIPTRALLISEIATIHNYRAREASVKLGSRRKLLWG